MADMECLNNENHLESDLSNEAQITSEMDKIIEVVKKYIGSETDDIKISVDNEEYVISATFTKKAIENMGKVDDILVNNESVLGEDKVARVNVPTKLSQLTNDSGLIDNTVNNLVNYYTKNETYTRVEVLELVADIPKFSVQIVSTLPTENISSTTIYLLAVEGGDSNNYYEEYLYANGKLELIGTTKIDLSNYYTKAEIDTIVQEAIGNVKLPDNLVTTDTEQNIDAKKIIAGDKTIVLDTLDNYTYTSKIRFITTSGERNLIAPYRAGAILIGDINNPATVLIAGNLLSFGNKSLGEPLNKWKDLYLSGNLSDGTNSISVSDLASIKTQIGEVDTLLTNLNTGEGV